MNKTKRGLKFGMGLSSLILSITIVLLHLGGKYIPTDGANIGLGFLAAMIILPWIGFNIFFITQIISKKISKIYLTLPILNIITSLISSIFGFILYIFRFGEILFFALSLMIFIISIYSMRSS